MKLSFTKKNGSFIFNIRTESTAGKMRHNPSAAWMFGPAAGFGRLFPSARKTIINYLYPAAVLFGITVISDTIADFKHSLKQKTTLI